MLDQPLEGVCVCICVCVCVRVRTCVALLLGSTPTSP